MAYDVLNDLAQTYSLALFPTTHTPILSCQLPSLFLKQSKQSRSEALNFLSSKNASLSF
jgi:hypothetical protein